MLSNVAAAAARMRNVLFVMQLRGTGVNRSVCGERRDLLAPLQEHIELEGEPVPVKESTVSNCRYLWSLPSRYSFRYRGESPARLCALK